MEAIISKIKNMSVESLKEMALKVNEDLSSEAGIVLGAILEVLIGKMNEDDFVAFAETL